MKCWSQKLDSITYKTELPILSGWDTTSAMLVSKDIYQTVSYIKYVFEKAWKGFKTWKV